MWRSSLAAERRRRAGVTIAAVSGLASTAAVERRAKHGRRAMPDAVDDRQPALALVVLDQRRGLLLVEVEAMVDRLRRVVVALHDVATADVADPRQLLATGWRRSWCRSRGTPGGR